LNALGADARAHLLASAVERRYAPGEVLYLEGSPARSIHLVLEGRVRVLRETHGRTVFIHDETDGGCLGEVPLFEGSTYPATAIAAEPSRCLVLPHERIIDAVRADPDFALALLARLAARVRVLVDRVDRSSSQSIVARLAVHLLRRSSASGDRAFTLGATQQQAAEELGTVRELVVRALRTLRDRGAIAALGGGRYRVSDEALLRRVASGGE
jgi:CRP/FNR family transcriptional regulator